jgi:hypothetical protein
MKKKQKFTEIDVRIITSLVKTGVELKKDDEFYLDIEHTQNESLIEENLDRILSDKKPKILSVELLHHQVAECFISLIVFSDHVELKFNMANILNIHHTKLAPCDSENIVKKDNSWEILVKDFVIISRSILNSSFGYGGSTKK